MIVKQKGTDKVKRGLAQMLKAGVIMDVTTPEQAIIAQEAGAVAVPLEPIPGIDTLYDIGVPIALIWYWFTLFMEARHMKSDPRLRPDQQQITRDDR